MGLSESRLPKNINVFITNFSIKMTIWSHLGVSAWVSWSAPFLASENPQIFSPRLRPRDHSLAGSFEISLKCHRQGHLPRGTGTRQVGGQVGGCYVVVKNVVNLNVWLFLSVNLAKCFVGVVWLMFGLDEGRVCWGCCGFTVWDSVH